MNNSREKFEAWYQTQFSEIVDFSLFAPTSAYYKDDDIDEAWDVWQAATEQSQKEIEALQAREKVLVDALRSAKYSVKAMRDGVSKINPNVSSDNPYYWELESIDALLANVSNEKKG